MDGEDFMGRVLEEEINRALDIDMEVDMNIDEFFRQQEQEREDDAPPQLRRIPDAEVPPQQEEEEAPPQQEEEAEEAAENENAAGEDPSLVIRSKEEQEEEDDDPILTARGTEMKGFSCMVCYDAFNTTSRIPKVFPCGHSFCLGCITGLFKSRSLAASSVNCPTCRANTRCTTQTDPKKVPTNYSILAMLEQRKEEGKIDDDSSKDLSSCFECNYFFPGLELTMCNHEDCQPSVRGNMLKAVDKLKRPKSLLICKACIGEKHSRHNYTLFEKVAAQYEANGRIVATEKVLKRGLRHADDALLQLGHTKNELMEHRRRMVKALENVRDQAEHPYIYDYLMRFTENVGASSEFFRKSVTKLKSMETTSQSRYYRSFGIDSLRPLGDVPEHLGPRKIKKEPRFHPYEPPAPRVAAPAPPGAGAGAAAELRQMHRPFRFAFHAGGAGQAANRPERNRPMNREAIAAGMRIDELAARARARAAAARFNEEDIGMPLGLGLDVLAEVAFDIGDPREPNRGVQQPAVAAAPIALALPADAAAPAAPADAAPVVDQAAAVDPAVPAAPPAAPAPIPEAGAAAPAAIPILAPNGERVLPIVIQGPPGLALQHDRIAALARMMIEAAVGPGANVLPAIVQAAPAAPAAPAPAGNAAVAVPPAAPAPAAQPGAAVVLRPAMPPALPERVRQAAALPPGRANRAVRWQNFDDLAGVGRRIGRRQERRDQLRNVAQGLQNAIANNPILAEFPDIQNAVDALNEHNEGRLDRDFFGMLEDDVPPFPNFPRVLRRRRDIAIGHENVDIMQRQLRVLQDQIDHMRRLQGALQGPPRPGLRGALLEEMIEDERLVPVIGLEGLDEDEVRRIEIQQLVPHLIGMVRNGAHAEAALANVPVADPIELPPILNHEANPGAPDPQNLLPEQIQPFHRELRDLERRLIQEGIERRARARMVVIPAQPVQPEVQQNQPAPMPMQVEEPAAAQVAEPVAPNAPDAPAENPVAPNAPEDDEAGPADLDRRRAGPPIPDEPAAKRRQD